LAAATRAPASAGSSPPGGRSASIAVRAGAGSETEGCHLCCSSDRGPTAGTMPRPGCGPSEAERVRGRIPARRARRRPEQSSPRSLLRRAHAGEPCPSGRPLGHWAWALLANRSPPSPLALAHACGCISRSALALCQWQTDRKQRVGLMKRIMVHAGHQPPLQPHHLTRTGAPGEAELVTKSLVAFARLTGRCALLPLCARRSPTAMPSRRDASSRSPLFGADRLRDACVRRGLADVSSHLGGAARRRRTAAARGVRAISDVDAPPGETSGWRSS
jgi:hypothetical protein